MAEQNQTKPKFRTSIGGQALIEGILMRGPEKQAIVVRSKEGLVEKVEELKLIRDRYPILGLPVLPVAIGIYLPIHLNAAIMLGGLVRLFVEKRKYDSEKEKNDSIQSGILYTSGMIAGEGVVGILLAMFAVAKVNTDISDKVNLGNIGGLVCFALLLLSILYFCSKGRKAAKN